MEKTKEKLSSFDITELFRNKINNALIPFMKNYSKSMYINYAWGYNIEYIFLLKSEKANLIINYNLKDDFIDVRFENIEKKSKITLYDLILTVKSDDYPLSNLQPQGWKFGASIANNIKYIKLFVPKVLNEQLFL